MNCVSCDICVYYLGCCVCFFPGVFLSSRVTGACPVTTDLIMRVNVRTTTTTTTTILCASVIRAIGVSHTAWKKYEIRQNLRSHSCWSVFFFTFCSKQQGGAFCGGVWIVLYYILGINSRTSLCFVLCFRRFGSVFL